MSTTTIDPDQSTEPGPPGSADTDRITLLKQQLVDEYQALIDDVEMQIGVLDEQLDTLTGERRRLADDLKTRRRDLARLTGDTPKTSARERGEFPCKDPGCDRTFATAQGATMHHTRSHKTGKPGKADRGGKGTPPPASTRSVYRCGQLDDLYADGVCGHEFRNLADLSHHTITNHRRQPTPAEKILVTPDR